MSEVAPNPNEAWRNFTTRSPITACKLRGTDDLKRLYKIVNQKQVEHGERVVGRFFKTEEETQQQFEARCTQTKDAFITTVRVAGENGEVVTGHGEGFFDSQLLPERIVSITYDTAFSPNALLKYTPTDRTTVFLDFSKPPLIDLTGQPSAPTPNNSNFFISAETEAWSTSLRSRLNEFFAQRSTSLTWIHNRGSYDACCCWRVYQWPYGGASDLAALSPIAGRFRAGYPPSSMCIYSLSSSAPFELCFHTLDGPSRE